MRETTRTAKRRTYRDMPRVLADGTLNPYYVVCPTCSAREGASCTQNGIARTTVHPARKGWREEQQES